MGEKGFKRDYFFLLKTLMGLDLCLNMMSLTSPSEILMKGKCCCYCVMLEGNQGRERVRRWSEDVWQ